MPTPRRRHIRFRLWDRSDSQLTPAKRLEKAKSLRAISLVRRHKASSLVEAYKQQGLDPSRVLQMTNAVKMSHGKLLPKTHDEIPRSMKIYEKGRLVHVEVANSEVASDIGYYWNAIGQLTETGKSIALRTLRRRRFKDPKGDYHTLEKDPKIILELEARKPKPEMFEIYKR